MFHHFTSGLTVERGFDQVNGELRDVGRPFDGDSTLELCKYFTPSTLNRAIV